jgi:hypothetical protein
MRAPDDLPEELEGDFRAGEIRDTRTAPECVERDPLYDAVIDGSTSLGRWTWDRDEYFEDWDESTSEAEGEPCPPN